jgi:ATP-binding cassette subfamily B protein
VGATIIASLFQLAVPQLIGSAVDGALGLLEENNTVGYSANMALFQTAALLLGVSILRGLFTLIHNYTGEAVGHMMAYDLRLSFYNKLQSLSFSFHDKVHTGELITRGMLDLEGVRMFVSTGLVRLVLLTVLIGVGSYLLLSTDLLLGALSLSFVPFVAYRSAIARLKLRSLWLALQERMSTIGRIMDENLTGIRVVRAFGAENYELDKYKVAADAAKELADERIKTRVSSTTIMTFAYFISMGLVLWFGGLRVLEGQLTIGDLTEFLAFMTILQLPVRQLGLLVNSFARASSTGRRLFAVLDMKPTISDKKRAKPLKITNAHVVYKNVSFQYDNKDQLPALNNISFELRKGHSLGIVGPPGSGKSTIAHLLTRFYDVSEGKITIDGQDLREVTLDTLRREVLTVPQDPFLFTTSLENNIAYGDPWAKDKQITDAAFIAQIDKFILGLPENYKTLVGERGVSLSGGQKQRISIARTIMLNPSVMILDDSTAAIDAATEQEIRQLLKTPMQSCATIFISHRLGTLLHADEIIFIDQGRIVERGTHESLIAKGGRYAELHILQNLSAENSEQTPTNTKDVKL